MFLRSARLPSSPRVFPERRAREIMIKSKEKGITIVGPATVGGIKPGAYKIGNTGGMMDNIVASKLYRKGSVGYVSKSGGMSNELNNIIAQNTDGVYEGIAIGGDRYPGTSFIDHYSPISTRARLQDSALAW